MAKKQDFASKIAKSKKVGLSCSTCGDVYSFVKKVESYYSEDSTSWKYKSKNFKVCKCNDKEVYS